MSVWHDFEFRWTHRDGSVNTYACMGYGTPEEARRDAERRAIMHGWTPPKWWQWWRRKDYPRERLYPAEGGPSQMPRPGSQSERP